jgi:hypothetical protein
LASSLLDGQHLCLTAGSGQHEPPGGQHAGSMARIATCPLRCVRAQCKKTEGMRERDVEVHTFCERDVEVHTFCERDVEVHTFCERDVEVHTFCERDVEVHTFCERDVEVHTFCGRDAYKDELFSH